MSEMHVLGDGLFLLGEKMYCCNKAIKGYVRRNLEYLKHEKPKEGVKTETNDHINLKVAGQDGSVTQFKIKRHTPLRKRMKAYCEGQLELEEEDTIDAFQQQTGGVY
ncbi:small ubiquitin-related modifier 2-like [Cynocephalus volans]|uniref:small ubiquitin-related modifier 2-like n=1 Tax=Cynocephalus volans TaxID=110931 RepID=UPI002FC59EBC